MSQSDFGEKLRQNVAISEQLSQGFTCIVFALHGIDPCFPWSAPTMCDSVASGSESGPTDDDSPLPGFLSVGSTTNRHTEALGHV